MPESPCRFRVAWICVLLLLLPVVWLLLAGPCNYLHPHLPRGAQITLELAYLPLPWLLSETDLEGTTVGQWYMHYLFWWAELKGDME